MIDKVPDSFKRIGYDLNDHAIHALKGIRDKVEEFPEHLNEDDYNKLRGTKPNEITSWIRIACSFGGIFESKLAKDSVGIRNYASEAKRNALKQSPKIQDVEFTCADYADLSFENCVIYCDPPYKNTSGYKTGEFDHDKFYEWCRKQSKNNVVFVSEYDAPDDFECIWQGEIKTNFASTRKKGKTAVEKLFIVR